MIDVAIAIDGEARNVLRYTLTGSHNADGEFIAVVSAPSTIRAAIFPASGNQLRDMPEGIRTDASWVCWSRSALAVDDQIAAAGISYRVLFAWPRPEGGFHRAALGRLTP